MPKMFFINSDISKAETLPATFYKDKDIFENVKEKIFLKTCLLYTSPSPRDRG